MTRRPVLGTGTSRDVTGAGPLAGWLRVEAALDGDRDVVLDRLC